MPPTLTILGSLNIDLVSRVPHHPLPGETLTATTFSLSPGGKGANQAVACAKLSRPSTSPSPSPSNPSATATVRMLGTVGSDSYGALLTSNLTAHGVDVSGVAVREGLKTGVAIIIVDEPTGENRIILSPEANHALQAGDVAGVLDLAGETDLLIMQLEIPVETVLAALRVARERGTPVLLNPAPAQTLPAGALKGIAHLVVNETEAAMLGGVEVSVLDEVAGLEAVARGFVEGEGVGNVIITLGGRGVYYMEGGEGGKRGLVPAEKAKVVDTTAAGDTFVGAYALEVVGGRFDIEEAVRKANRAAAKTVERRGAQDSIPWRDELV
ncbi:Ribokinase-like protein [Podospora conica]|nr:Ribokinase-like protein [Schizothecium conicum]